MGKLPSDPDPKTTGLLGVDSHPVRQVILAETKVLSKTQVFLPLGMAIATFIVNLWRGEVVSLGSGLGWALLSIFVGLVLFYLIAVIRAPFVVIGRHHQEITTLRSQVSELEANRPAGEDPNRAKLGLWFFNDRKHEHWENGKLQNRVSIYNSGPAVARDVEVFLERITPSPRSKLFRADFPYRLITTDSTLKRCDINPKSQEIFHLLTSWSSEDEGLMIEGLDTKPGASSPFKMESDERWHFYIKATCANADVKKIILYIEPLDNAVEVTHVDLF